MSVLSVAAKPRILLVDDEPTVRRGYSRFLSRMGFEVDCASTLLEGDETSHSGRFAVALIDVNLPDGSALPWLEVLRERQPEALIIAFSASSSGPYQAEALEHGAHHFFPKPIKMRELGSFLQNRLSLQEAKAPVVRSGFVFGSSPTMRDMRDLAEMAASSDASILIEGETGTGKSKLAHWIHERSLRADGPFVEVNCSTLEGSLLNSELFGHARGAFTSAVSDREGLLAAAHGGTLFLDEIGDMEPSTQTRLLKVIEEKCYRRVGDNASYFADFRLICATNKDLWKEVEEGRFRRDLFFRINVIPLQLPGLAERKEDVAMLAHALLDELGTGDVSLSADCLSVLMEHHWPGNVRELRNVLERALVLSRGRPLVREHFERFGFRTRQATTPMTLRLEDVEQAHIRDVLAMCQQDTQQAADLLGVSRATLYRKLKKNGVIGVFAQVTPKDGRMTTETEEKKSAWWALGGKRQRLRDLEEHATALTEQLSAAEQQVVGLTELLKKAELERENAFRAKQGYVTANQDLSDHRHRLEEENQLLKSERGKLQRELLVLQEELREQKAIHETQASASETLRQESLDAQDALQQKLETSEKARADVEAKYEALQEAQQAFEQAHMSLRQSHQALKKEVQTGQHTWIWVWDWLLGALRHGSGDAYPHALLLSAHDCFARHSGLAPGAKLNNEGLLPFREAIGHWLRASSLCHDVEWRVEGDVIHLTAKGVTVSEADDPASPERAVSIGSLVSVWLAWATHTLPVVLSSERPTSTEEYYTIQLQPMLS